MSVGPRRLIGRHLQPATPEAPSTWLTAAGDTVEVLADRAGAGNPQKWYWRVLAPTGKQVGSSGQLFNRARSARRAARRMFPEATS